MPEDFQTIGAGRSRVTASAIKLPFPADHIAKPDRNRTVFGLHQKAAFLVKAKLGSRNVTAFCRD
jgi:hypothetical protein